MKFLKIILLFLITIKGFSDHFDINNPELMKKIRSIEEKPIVILVTSYNNERYAKDNMTSVLKQWYSNYRVIFINDCSCDNTLKIAQSVIEEMHAEDRVMVVDNKTRKLGLRNYYEAIIDHTKDEEIIVCVDGDDRLAGPEVLCLLNAVYSNPEKETWLTYGQFQMTPSYHGGWNVQVPSDIVKNNRFRDFFPRPTHLRTFYSWLFKKININDLKYNDNFFEMTWDLAFMFPMLEMCGERFTFIQNYVYLYNIDNPINDHKVNIGLQSFYTGYIMSLPKYKTLNHSVFSSCDDNTCNICNKDLKHEIYEKKL